MQFISRKLEDQVADQRKLTVVKSKYSIYVSEQKEKNLCYAYGFNHTQSFFAGFILKETFFTTISLVD